MADRVIVGSRGSMLALAQTNLMIAALAQLHPGLTFEVRRITTQGDRQLDRPLNEIGGKGVFVKEIEESLLAGEIDMAVHSFKDVPGELPPGLAIAAVPARADVRDVLVGRAARTLDELPAGARVGTSSLRRATQVRVLRPDLQILDVRGNIDTRLRKLEEGQFEAIVLAAAGLERLHLLGRATQFFDPDVFLPAPGQGALALETRADDLVARGLLASLNDPATETAVAAERAFLRRLGGGCQLPLAAHSRLSGDRLTIRGMLASESTCDPVYVQLEGPAHDPEALGCRLADEILRLRSEQS